MRHPHVEPARHPVKRIKLGSAKANAQKSVSWEPNTYPTELHIMELARQKEQPFVLGFNALHWACELGLSSLVYTIIAEKLVHPETFSSNERFVSFTPIFAGISSLWLAALADRDKGGKEERDFEAEQSCLSVIQIFADFGAALDSEVEIHLSNDARH